MRMKTVFQHIMQADDPFITDENSTAEYSTMVEVLNYSIPRWPN